MAVDSLGQLTVDLIANTGGFEAGMDRAQRSLKSATKEAAYQATQLDKLVGQIDPVVGAYGRLDKMEEQLRAHRKAGRLDTSDFDEYLKKLNQQRDSLGLTDKALGKNAQQFAANGQSLKQYQNNLRGIPAQFTDIVVSLQGGQKPLTVFLQQGGQLKDMFGGAGQAAKALSGYVVSLINPLTVGAAAAAALGAAYYQGSKEATAYNTALINTGNFAGTSANSLAGLATNVSNVVGTVGQASEVLATLAGTGKLAVGSFEMIADAALLTQKATGRAATEIVADFVKIADEPTKASLELNKQMNYLTETVYSQIAAFEKSGDKQAAATLAEQEYAKALTDRSNKIIEDLGYVEKAWNVVMSAAKGAWDAFAGVGRPDALQDQIKKAQELVDTLAASKKNALPGMPSNSYREEQAQKDLTDLLVQYEEKKRRESSMRVAAQQTKDLTEAAVSLDKIHEGFASNDMKRTKERADYERDVAKLRDGVKTGKVKADDPRLDAERIAKDLDNIDEKYADKKAARTKAYQEDAGTKELDQAKQQYAVLQQQAAQLDEQTGKSKTLGAAQQELIKWEQQLADIKNKDTLTAAQKSLLATADQITKQKELNAALEKDTAARTASALQAAQLAEFQQKISDDLMRAQRGLDDQVVGVGLGAEGRKRLKDDLAIQQDYADQVEKLRRDKLSGKITQETYDKETEILGDALQKRLAMQQENYRKLAAARADWSNGANAALQDYLFEASDVAGQSYTLFSDSLHGIEDAFVDLATSGKLSFKNLADSVIADLARIAARTLIVQPLIAALFSGGGAGGVATVGGLAAIFGASGSSGSSSSGGGMSLGSVANAASTAYSLITGVGPAAAAGYASGGILGAGQGIASYYTGLASNAVTSITGAVTGWFGSSAAASAASGTGYALGGTLVAGEAGSASYAAGAGTSGALGGAASMWPLAVLMGMIQSGKLYSSGVRPDASAMYDSAGSTGVGKVVMSIPTLTAKAFEIVDGALSKIVGGKAAAILTGSTLYQAVWSKVGTKLFGSGYETKDMGIQLGVTDGEFDADQYTKQKKKGGLLSGSSKTRYLYNDLDADTKDALGSEYNETVLGATALFTQLGVKLTDSVLDGLNMASSQISTQGKTAEQIQAEVDHWFALLGDQVVVAVSQATDAGVSGFSYVGLQAFVKNLYDVNAVLKHLNVGIYDMTVSGGFMAEQLSAWAGGIDALKTAVAAYYDAFFTDTQKSMDSLQDVRDTFTSVNQVLPDSRDGFKAMVEGIDKSTESGRQLFLTLMSLAQAADTAYDIMEARQSTYYGAFFSESENAARTMATLTDEFKKANITLPGTRAGYRAMVEGIDRTTASGKKLYETLMALSGDADTFYKAQEQMSAAAVSAAMSVASNAMSTLQRAVNAEKTKLTAAYNAQVTALNAVAAAAQSSISDLTSMGSALDAALKSLNGTSDTTVKMLRAQAQATIAAALAFAQGGGSLGGYAGLTDALSTVSDNNTDLYSSLEDFNREQGRTANIVAQLNAINGDQLTVQEKALKAAQDQLVTVQALYDAQMQALDDQLAQAQAQLDALNGIDNSVISVAAAIAALNTAIMAALSAMPKGSAAANTPGNNSTLLDSVYQSVLGRDADTAGAAYWAGLLQSGGVDYAGLAAAIKADAQANGELPHYAKGTNNWDGSPALVGEFGPEIVSANNLGGSTIYPAQRSRSLLSGGAGSDQDAADAQNWREKALKKLNEIARNTGWLDFWNSDGLPGERA